MLGFNTDFSGFTVINGDNSPNYSTTYAVSERFDVDEFITNEGMRLKRDHEVSEKYAGRDFKSYSNFNNDFGMHKSACVEFHNGQPCTLQISNI